MKQNNWTWGHKLHTEWIRACAGDFDLTGKWLKVDWKRDRKCSNWRMRWRFAAVLRTRRFGTRVFKLFVTIEIGSYVWSQVTMLQGKPLEFSDFHCFAANAVSVNTFSWKIEADRRTAIGGNHIFFLLRSKCANLDLKSSWLNPLITSFL